MFKKIKKIKGMAVYSNFDWDSTVKDGNGRPSDFKTVNILYGRNYSGKTTLSRIFRSLELGVISDKYQSPKFEFELSSGGLFNETQIPYSQGKVRVFNEDFVKENLRFIVDDEQSVNSFAILGDDNNRLEHEIQIREAELGSDGVSGKVGIYNSALAEYLAAKKATESAVAALESKVSDKANNKATGIKHNRLYGDATYNAPKLNKDIDQVLKKGFTCVEEAKVPELESLLREEVKAEISSFSFSEPLFSALYFKAKQLVEVKITVTQPLRELLEDNLLEDWVRKGRRLHQSVRADCGFCGAPLPDDLWDKLDLHFNKESEDLRGHIGKLLSSIESEQSRFMVGGKIDISQYYSNFREGVLEAELELRTLSGKYTESLDALADSLKERLKDIFHAKKLPPIEDLSAGVLDVYDKLEKYRVASNKFTSDLSGEKKRAQTSLKLRDVFRFVSDIKFLDEKKNIASLEDNRNKKNVDLAAAKVDVDRISAEIVSLKAELKDESKGADRVNIYLNDFFGHRALSLKSEEIEGGFKFEVIRNGAKAHHLSEGECSLIAFCYFMAKLHDIETKGFKPVIYIDDPISSLDSNHIFFIFSLISSEIVGAGNYSQLFISTHNLDFLKYLKRLAPLDVNGVSQERRYFIIENSGGTSSLRVMPGYLKSYVTEFNYLFHQVFKCANAADVPAEQEHECYYNYGNNARKFLEAFLYFKYPNANEKDNNKLERFFGSDSKASMLTERIHNEYSHLAGVFERSINPIDVPEMKRSAQFILNKMKEKDPEQYSAFLESIGSPVVNF
ncbi:AAA family ATPase [Pseudomonas sp. 14P_5.3_Bac1]|uniref:AAA family ATPase n=1 Tax=Pseudomonas sp. 14P_5.3_Bac1 TaxID=2971622 RepID=UPI0021C58731|nr:AAA family ATPase [Pseudomonas sp. 14P_5.3_Bac1]MCU1778511.1 AAA family ATPase [Pseudomonas sp. 14P_5.3_Bac1]